MPEHYKIAAQTIKWINKCRRFIFLKKEMAKPRKSISAKGYNNKPKPFAGDDPENDTNENEQRPGKV